MENIALTMREIADKVNEDKEQKKVAQHKEHIDTVIIPRLKEEAEAGRYSLSFSAPGYDIMLLRQLLKNKGFAADTYMYSKTRHLMVRW